MASCLFAGPGPDSPDPDTLPGSGVWLSGSGSTEPGDADSETAIARLRKWGMGAE